MSKSNLYKKIGQAGWSEEDHTPRKQTESFYDYDSLDKASTGKKISKRKTPKKTKHKHDYEQVICVYKNDVFGRSCKEAVLRKKCKICGKLDGWIHPTVKDPISCGSRWMTFEETMNIYHGLEVINYD